MNKSSDSQYPSYQDLAQHLHFVPDEGKVWFDEQRAILETLQSLATLRREIVDTLGIQRARALVLRTGYQNGKLDAELAKKYRSNVSLKKLFLAGPQLHMLRGRAQVKQDALEIDSDKGVFYSVTSCTDSYEVEMTNAELGDLDMPVCWHMVGYASGYTSNIMGIDVLFKEIECSGKGDTRCRVIGKPLTEWDEEDAEEFKVFSDSDPLITTLHELQEKANVNLEKVHIDNMVFSTLVGESKGFKHICSLANKAAHSTASVLLTGETGVGKELIAKGIHEYSARSSQPFIAMNCAAIPPELIESELFGVEKGAFTGASHSRKGKFARANNGTIFLDEVIELSPRAQASLLRVLQEKEFEPIGGVKTQKIDIRIIAASNEDLEKGVKEGRFRADLYYRLNVFPLHIPALRQRREDIPLLANHFIEKYEAFYSTKTLGLSDRAQNELLSYQWPGNIRELENTIERGVILAGKNKSICIESLFPQFDIQQSNLSDIPVDGLPTVATSTNKALDSLAEEILTQSLSIETLESTLINKAIDLSDGNISKAARLLGLSRPAFAYRLKRLNAENQNT